ncbi:c-type cytochrome [Roseovarius aquimarinus]|uniref:C-type cytochrome n=1 Tax=Roseovarius aquimarinus TaxID=1229156 RepID=A0ABW7I494_9RHOB
MTARSIIRVSILAGAIAAASALVSAWALASPASDPIGRALGWLGQGSDHVAAWYASDPVADMPDWRAMRLDVAGGDAARGRDLMRDHGCGACHRIPGVPGAHGTVGPSLAGLAERAYIAGILTNAPGELTRWLIDPPYFSQDTAMPDLGVTEAEAMDMTAYLYTLGGDE